MKALLSLLIVLLSSPAFSQTTFRLADFSNAYYGNIYIADTSAIFSKGWVAVCDARSGRELIRVESEELALELHNGQALANIRQLPYGEQSLLMYDDFNFDGKKDFALCDGQNSCYHGPSFQIYLAAEQGFVLSEPFTRLAQEYCGMFDWNPQTKRIHTMTKSGCCWHEFSEFAVVDNVPKPVRIEVLTHAGLTVTQAVTTFPDGRPQTTTRKTLDFDNNGLEVLLSFRFPNNQKQLLLFQSEQEKLHYALLRPDSTLEFLYPAEDAEDEANGFTLTQDAAGLSLSFDHQDAAYRIYEGPGGIGIRIQLAGKTYHWAGSKASRKGSLRSLQNRSLNNVN